jgi:Xaa-Pro aminopeptidase
MSRLGRALEIFQREPLYRNGWNYRHGSGHGIGSYLYIHEGRRLNNNREVQI